MFIHLRCGGGLLFNRDGKCVTNEFRRAKEEEAAIKIQSRARGMLAKKKVQKAKEEKANEKPPESPELTVVSKAPKAT